MTNLLTVCAICHNMIHDRKLKVEVLSVSENDVVIKFSLGEKP